MTYEELIKEEYLCGETKMETKRKWEFIKDYLEKRGAPKRVVEAATELDKLLVENKLDWNTPDWTQFYKDFQDKDFSLDEFLEIIYSSRFCTACYQMKIQYDSALCSKCPIGLINCDKLIVVVGEWACQKEAARKINGTVVIL